MKLMVFEITGKVKEVSKKKVLPGQIIRKPSCFDPIPIPLPKGSDYWEVVLEKCQISYAFGNESPKKNVRLTIFGKKFSESFEKKFAIGEKYLFSCTGGTDYYFPHS
jgi:hypothetical protein